MTYTGQFSRRQHYFRRVAILKEAGLCVMCGKGKPVEDRTRCRYCLDYAKRAIKSK